MIRTPFLPRLGLLALLFLLGTGGCQGDLRDPTGFMSPPDTSQVGTGTNGGSGGGSGAGVLVGTWEATFLYQVPGDVQRHTVTWSFAAGGTCRKTVEIYSVLEDRTITTSTACTFRAGSGDVAITFSGNTGAITFRWSLADFSRNSLELDGVTYDRVG